MTHESSIDFVGDISKEMSCCKARSTTDEEETPTPSEEEAPFFRQSRIKTPVLIVTPTLEEEEKKNELHDWRTLLEERLYSRPQEEAELLQSFHHLRTTPKRTLILISGPTGSGRTRLARTLMKPTQEMNGFFLTGKFDQLQHPAPYMALVSAFTEFTNIVVKRGKDAVRTVRHAVENAISPADIAALTRTIPALERIMGGHSTETKTKSPAAKTEEVRQRFVLVFRKFIRALCSPEQPMVLLMDDLQYADPCCLDILVGLVNDEEKRGLVLVATCVENVSSRSYLSQKLRAIEDENHEKIVNIRTSNLPESAVGELLGSALSLDLGEQQALGRIVYNSTEGNLVDVVEFLSWMEGNELLYFDETSGNWSWDKEDIDMTINRKESLDFLVDKIQKLSGDVKETLKVASCLGIYLDQRLLEYAMGRPVDDALREAAMHGILFFDKSRGGYFFEHDGVQAAVYSLIPAGQPRELFHLEIGRRLWRMMESDEVETYIFTLLAQINIGRNLITRENEKIALANLCLQGATKAGRLSSWRTGLVYLELALSLLSQRSWRSDYELTLSIHNTAAEMALITTNLERTEELVESVLRNAKTLQDKIGAYCTRIYALSMSERSHEGIEVAFEVLKALGETVPRRFRLLHIGLEMHHVNSLLKGKSDEQLLRLPIMTNPNKLKCLQILSLILLNAVMRDGNLTAWIVLRMMRLTLEHGLSVFSSTAFAAYGMICIGKSQRLLSENVNEGFRFGKLGLKLLDRFDAREFLPRVYAFYYGGILAWRMPITMSLEPLLEGYKVGLQTGDIEAACMCANFYWMNAMDAGLPLDIVQQEGRRIQETMISNRMKSLMLFSMPAIENINEYMGIEKRCPACRKGTLADYCTYEVAFEITKSTGQEVLFVSLKFCRLLKAVTLREMDMAESLLSESLRDVDKIPPCFGKIIFLQSACLVLLESARQGRHVRKNLRLADGIIEKVRLAARLSPHNCSDKLFFLEAEAFSARGLNDSAYEKYICALAMAKDSSFIFYCAMINEYLARHLARIGEYDRAKSFFDEALRFYREWKAKMKVDLLEAEILDIYSKASGELSL